MRPGTYVIAEMKFHLYDLTHSLGSVTMRKIREIAAFLVSLFVLTASANVQAATLDFSFSWTNTFGTVPGTVTGEIRGLSDGLGLVFQPASAIFVTSAPAALGFPASPSDNLLTFSNFGVPTAVNSNLFWFSTVKYSLKT
jgi:hypothetical protein